MFELLKNYGFEETVLKFDANKFHICQLTNIVLKFWIFLNVSVSGLRIRIRIQKDFEFGSNTDSDPRHCPAWPTIMSTFVVCKNSEESKLGVIN